MNGTSARRGQQPGEKVGPSWGEARPRPRAGEAKQPNQLSEGKVMVFPASSQNLRPHFLTGHGRKCPPLLLRARPLPQLSTVLTQVQLPHPHCTQSLPGPKVNY